jgi:hypothetical protein
MQTTLTAAVLCALLLAPPAAADVFNLKVVTDASPDYSDLPSLVRSATSRWDTPEENAGPSSTGTTSRAARPPP